MSVHLAKTRDDRSRSHISEVRADILADMDQRVITEETQAVWAKRLAVAYRTLKIALRQLRLEGKVDAVVGRGRYAHSSYKLSNAYLSEKEGAIT